jgi:preprotein translocase subunit SecA
MARLRPSGSGKAVTASAFMRATATPSAALVFRGGGATPDGWPVASGTGASDTQLGHAVGWVCEVRRDHVVLINPLGEGLFRAPLPSLDDAWVHDVRASTSAAIYVLGDSAEDVDATVAVDLAALDGPITAATVRTAIAEDYGRAAPVGRNAPCPCGSGKKFKLCHGK